VTFLPLAPFYGGQVPCWSIVILLKAFNIKALIKGEAGGAFITLMVRSH
jgi:hypothetical protein